MKYRIDLSQTVIQGATVFVEADSREEAEDAVLTLAEDGAAVEWKFVDVVDDMEIVNIEECPPVNELEPPEGVTMLTLEDPATMHAALARAVGEDE